MEDKNQTWWAMGPLPVTVTEIPRAPGSIDALRSMEHVVPTACYGYGNSRQGRSRDKPPTKVQVPKPVPLSWLPSRCPRVSLDPTHTQPGPRLFSFTKRPSRARAPRG